MCEKKINLNMIRDYLLGKELEMICKAYHTNKEKVSQHIEKFDQYVQDIHYNTEESFNPSKEIREKLYELKQRNLELKAAINSSYDGIWITDKSGDTIFVNKAIERITGLSAKHVIGKNMKDLVEQGVFNVSATLKVMENKETVTVMQKVKTGIETIVTGNPSFDQKGDIFRIISNVRDITELNKLKEQIEIMEEKNQRYHLELTNLKLKFDELANISFRSSNMDAVVNKAVRLARFDTTALLLGESGVGKEIIAELIHESSPRKETGSFIRVNCSALPRDLLESELFGYQGGAFTGAQPQGKPGMFEIANHGTIFLDEIGDLPLNIQAKFLRVLQENEIYRLGGVKPIKINTRVIAATNKNLEDMVKEGRFREDLYYRLNVVPVTLPPLRERKEDIPALIHHFLNYFNEKYKLNKHFSPNIVEVLLAYSWPGNVRELKNLVERLIVTTEDEVVTTEHLPSNYLYKHSYNHEEGRLKQMMQKTEKEIIFQTLDRYASTYKAAEVLGISQSSMSRKAQKYGYKRREERNRF
jgi:PAS domain S-box-containing protein